ncbi:c-type heme family protein [Undibacterium sp. TJN25]|uniref:c-type heme family protein n=1 Tax=Undibacterium sp. TJN25 TaxID=3413056 RepID=UPI003BF2E2F0
MKMSIATKFNLVFISIFAIGFVAAGLIANALLKESAREETLQNARFLLESALAVRTYTSKQIAPLLQTQMKYQFHPQSVPSYSATENLNTVLKSYPDFTYKEATLNPTNLRDKASDWEADVVHKLRSEPTMKEYVGERDTPIGRALYIARPLQIKDPACLACHSTADAAPKTMTDIYGPNNGFGWNLNEIIGAQVISVPMAVPLQRANSIFKTFMLSLLGVFVFVFIALNIMVHYFVTRRITNLANTADQVSMGKFDVEEFDVKGNDELSALAQSFGRMRTSLSSALKMLEE